MYPGLDRAARGKRLAFALAVGLAAVSAGAQPDPDADGISDYFDNCTAAFNPDQRDTDGDLYGNRCDADFNNDCVVNAGDLAVMKTLFFASGDLVTDMDGDGITGFADLGLVRSQFFAAPGPGLGGCDAPAVRINEFLPDPFGRDADPGGARNGGHEAIEIVNAGDAAVDLSFWRIDNAAGQTLFTFPEGTVLPPADDEPTIVLVVLGSRIDSLAEDFGDFGSGMTPGAAILFAGIDAGDRIDNGADALVLRNGGGGIVDAVLFGETEPDGPAVDEARSGGHWNGPRINTSLAEGGVPLGDGEGVLGRDRLSSDSDSAGDWRVHGGADAFGGTFGHANGPNRFPVPQELVHHVQGYVNELAAMLSINNSPSDSAYLAFTYSSYAGLAMTGSGDDYTVAAEHSFEYTSTDFFGDVTVGSLVGEIVIDYHAEPGQTDTVNATGVLTDDAGDRSLAITLSETFEGYGTATVTSVLQIDMTWSDPTGTYTYTNIATRSDAWTAQFERTAVDHREYTDWSTPEPKISDATYVTRYIVDGKTRTEATIVRSEPFYHQGFGATEPLVPGSRSELAAVYSTSVGSDGEVFRRYEQYDMYLLGQDTRVLYVELDPGTDATLTRDRTGGNVGDFIGTYEEVTTLPLIVYHLGQYAEPRIVTKHRDITLEYVPGPESPRVFVARGPADIYVNGVQRMHFGYYIDGWMKWVAKGAQATAVGLCAAGATATAPSVIGAFGFAAGSAMVVGIWQEVEKQH